MGIFERLFGKRQDPARKASETFRLLEGYSHAFTTWQGSIFESDLIRAALDAHGRHAAKLAPNMPGTAKQYLRGKMQLGIALE